MYIKFRKKCSCRHETWLQEEKPQQNVPQMLASRRVPCIRLGSSFLMRITMIAGSVWVCCARTTLARVSPILDFAGDRRT